MESYVKSEIIDLKNHNEITERWVQDRIMEDPSILNLGDLIVKDSERIQPTGGRLDLLLCNPETDQRYEVELQLGACDESHIIRTIEYWDVERKRFPQYKHCAVIIAEDITSRFFNVISLFGGNIPIIAIQLKALKYDNRISLFFTTVLNTTEYNEPEEDVSEPTDRKYWEEKGSEFSLTLTDELLRLSEQVAPGYSLKYNKYYIGLAKNGLAKNYISFTPRKEVVILSLKIAHEKEIDDELQASDLEILAYDNQFNNYRIRIHQSDLEKERERILKLMQRAFDNYKG